ncbi:auxin efflux carrier [Auriculariales sp. MPI-PUGE-AT-0066]|nr:auxin efflux carrier [Auriculariales sp. MPI-PUGE-AT-0066]
MPAIGAIVWISCRPLIKMALATGVGFTLSRMGIFNSMHARGCGQVLLKALYPALLFSKMVTGITTDNVSAIGPVAVCTLLYFLIGGIMSFIITTFFWVPHRFRYGIYASGIFSNVGDVPLAVSISITALSPFAGQKDTDVAIAYIAVASLVFFLVMFSFGGYSLIVADFSGPDQENIRRSVREQISYTTSTRTALISSLFKSKKAPVSTEESADVEKADTTEKAEDPSNEAARADTSSTNSAEEHRRAAWEQHVQTITRTVRSLFQPITVAMSIGLVMGLVKPLKALLVHIPNDPIPDAPDGQPPLAFIMDTTVFLGNGAVPLGLMCLGTALAQLKVPRSEWRRLPHGAIFSLALGKLFVMPIFGVLIVEGFVKIGFIDVNDKVLRFVLIFLSCVPTATTQVLLTQIYSPDGKADDVSAFLLPQYLLMLLSMTIVIAYALHIIF